MSNEQMSEKMMAELQEYRAKEAKKREDYQKWGERYRVRMMLYKEKAEKAGIRVTDAEVDAEVAKRAKK